jgi:hypothetical protein
VHNIKQLKPSRQSRFKQEYINPQTCHKLFESLKQQPIIVRSSWEKKFIQWCETSNKVKSWGSECIGVSYVNPIDGEKHTYYPDFCVETTDGERWIVEIKPFNQTQKPDKNNKWLVEQYVKNMAKWNTIQEQCDRKGYKFFVLTERTIYKML